MSDFGHAFNTLIGHAMLIAIMILFLVLLMAILHLYACRYLLRPRPHRCIRIVIYVGAAPDATGSRGLDASVLESLPVFDYSGEGGREPLVCPVCLSDFEESEKARFLPKCGHSFHINCIDTWLHSHSTCPFCRSPVEPLDSVENLSVPSAPAVSDIDPSSGEFRCDEYTTSRAGPSTLAPSPEEQFGVSIEVPTMTEFEDKPGCESQASQQYRSPMSRTLSFRRIPSSDRRRSLSPSAAGGAAGQADVERGSEGTQSAGLSPGFLLLIRRVTSCLRCPPVCPTAEGNSGHVAWTCVAIRSALTHSSI